MEALGTSLGTHIIKILIVHSVELFFNYVQISMEIYAFIYTSITLILYKSP